MADKWSSTHMVIHTAPSRVPMSDKIIGHSRYFQNGVAVRSDEEWDTVLLDAGPMTQAVSFPNTPQGCADHAATLALLKASFDRGMHTKARDICTVLGI